MLRLLLLLLAALAAAAQLTNFSNTTNATSSGEVNEGICAGGWCSGTCCRILDEFCCPESNAVCCTDGSYCCPQSYPYCQHGDCANTAFPNNNNEVLPFLKGYATRPAARVN
eukprot:TRINITY_DN3231_c0_g1_i2.p1 TRINITY_DN3231_c0_g1~~TRINITY_DN3231_c0_g1_i2.p1  ORF type:complete len:112 (-),score=6.26 TRINITY_DN3231_c0_g1_i2:625-960(-)